MYNWLVWTCYRPRNYNGACWYVVYLRNSKRALYMEVTGVTLRTLPVLVHLPWCVCVLSLPFPEDHVNVIRGWVASTDNSLTKRGDSSGQETDITAEQRGRGKDIKMSGLGIHPCSKIQLCVIEHVKWMRCTSAHFVCHLSWSGFPAPDKQMHTLQKLDMFHSNTIFCGHGKMVSRFF